MLQDALFLYERPSWSQADLDATDQDLIDLLEAIDSARARVVRDEQLRRDAKARAAARRSR